MFKAAAFSLVLAFASTSFAQVVNQLDAPGVVGNASFECAGGVKYDSGTFASAYSLGSGTPNASTLAMKFTLPAGTTGIEQVCLCFTRTSSGSATESFTVLVYDDNGPSGKPGTLLGSASETITSIPVFPATKFVTVTMPAGIAIPSDRIVYVGVRWSGGQILLCGDRSSTIPTQTMFGSANSGSSWTSVSTMFPTGPPNALGIRVDPITTGGTCTPSTTALCLNNNRFRVNASFLTGAGQSGNASVVKLTEDTGYLWFFSSSNVEAVVKVLNACTFNDRYWVFAGGLTDVEVTVTITDTQRGNVRTYFNSQGKAFAPVQDTSAFATCP